MGSRNNRTDNHQHVFIAFIFIFINILTQVESPLFSLDPTLSLNQYVLDEWSSRSGLPTNLITSILQTADGYIWFGTANGLLRFDGHQFTVFNNLNIPGLSDNKVNSLYVNREGVLWFSTNEGLFRYSNGNFKKYNQEDGLSSNIITVLLEDVKGNLWVGTMDGYLNCIRKDGIEIYDQKNGLDDPCVFSINEDNQGRIRIGTKGRGLYVLEADQFKVFKIKGLNYSGMVLEYYEDSKGNILYITPHGIIFGKDGKFEFISRRNGLSSNMISTVKEDRNGNIWVGTINGINRITREGKERFQLDKSLESIPVTALLEDREGSIWIGTNGFGIKRYRAGKFITFTEKEGLESSNVFCLFQDKSKKIWISTAAGLITFENHNFTSHMNEFPFEMPLAIAEDSENDLWFGTYYYGIYRRKNNKWKNFTVNNGLAGNMVYSFISDREETLWIVTDNGISRYQQGAFFNYGKESGLPAYRIFSLFENHSGELFAAAQQGLFRFSRGKFSQLHKDLSGIFITGMIEISNNVYLIGTIGNGLKRLKNNKIFSIKKKDGLPGNTIFSLVEDDYGYLWFTCNQGIIRVRKQHLNEYCDGILKKLEPDIYNESDGLKTTDFQISFQSILKKDDGKFWFATKRGISEIHPGHININKVPPPVIIEEILAEKKPGKKAGNRFNNIKRIEFRFTAPTFIANEKVHFKYKLVGFEKDWIESDDPDQRKAVYSNLPPGKYMFKVIACNSDGVWNNKGDIFEFEIYRHFYQTLIFKMVIMLVMLLLMTAILYFFKQRFRIKKIGKKSSLAIDQDRLDLILKKLRILLNEDKVYEDAELTLMKLAEKLSVYPHTLSQIINEKLGKNFNDLINSYRIEAVKKRLQDPREAKRSVLEIAFDCGFNSKTSFNRAFKKLTGKTPSFFKQK